MKKLILIGLTILFAQSAIADTHVNGYYRSNGTYVQPHYRSDANGTARDNYSYQGNTNPYTGTTGTSTRLDKGDYKYGSNSNNSQNNSGCVNQYDLYCNNKK